MIKITFQEYPNNLHKQDTTLTFHGLVFAIPSFLGWILPYLCYRTINKKKTEEVMPLIDLKYDEMYTICDKASGLPGK